MTLRQKYTEIKKATIYEIICLTTGQRYIGSTIDYKNRKSKHKNKKNKTESKNITKNNNYKFNILEEFYCNYELSKLLKEQYYLDNLVNINKQRALNKIKNYTKEYYKINKNKIKLSTKKYEEENKQKIKQNKRKKYKCDCGKIISKGYKTQHNKSKFHLDYLRKNTI